MRTLGSGFAALFLVAGIVFGQALENEVLRRSAVIKPRPDEVKWQKVPWIADLAEGQRLAQAERRPLFLWATAGTLDRC